MSSVLVEIKECLLLAVLLFLSPFALYGVVHFLRSEGMLGMALCYLAIAYFLSLFLCQH